MEFEFIKFSMFFDTISQDLRKYADNNLVTERIVKQSVRRVTEELGYRLFQSKQCKIIVENYKAPTPSDLWKIENLFALCPEKNYDSSRLSNSLSGLIGMFKEEFHFGPEEHLAPSLKEKIEYMGVVKPCESECCTPSHISSYINPEYFIQNESLYLYPLHMSKTVKGLCTTYSPCPGWEGDFQVDLRNKEFIFSFKEGIVFLSYLGDLVDEEGEMLIPYQSALYEYYKWCTIQYVLEDMLLNTDVDIVNVLKWADSKRVGAKIDAMNYLLSPYEGQIEKIRKQRHMEFYNKWYKVFDNVN